MKESSFSVKYVLVSGEVLGGVTIVVALGVV
jgi:hypothetical protein